MKKFLTIILLLITISPLAACSLFSNQSKPLAPQKDSDEKLNYDTVSKNNYHWDEKTKNVKVETTSYGGSEDYALIPTSLSELKQYNKLLIKGTVYNLQEMHGADNEAYTKVSVYVNKVISGDRSLQDKIINFTLNSGFIYKPDQDEFNYQRKAEVPMPQIGAKTITGLTKRKINQNSKNQVNQFFIKNNCATKDSFKINDPAYNLWIKNPGMNQYKLNNPYLGKHAKDNWYSKKLLQLTVKINQTEK